jgi:glycosyltransferase involved in cell wall biosynthesis
MTWLYEHKKVKALVSISHGEGFGLPLFEAAYNGLPIITSLWSGHVDFLYAPNKSGKLRPMVAKVGYTLGPVSPEAHWEGVVEKDSMWAYPIENEYKRQLREVNKNYPRFKSTANKLKKHIKKNFDAEIIYKEFVSAICPEEEMEWLNTLGEIEII